MFLALVWHMHQPWYGRPGGRTLELPWVRLHGVKDYLDMPMRIEAHPGMCATFNLVPSLMAQIEAYGRGVSDLHRDLSLSDPAGLSPDETATILAHFFTSPHSTLDRRLEGYRLLRDRRDALAPRMGGREMASHFTPAEILDIQVFWNLAWVDPIFEDDPAVASLWGRSGGFTIEERDRLLAFHTRILGRIVPAYRRLEESGRAELITSPFFHPILPLLCDSECARPGLPVSPLPGRRFRFPEDARRHVRMAVADHEQRFGRRPRGVWPSEGSVSDEAAGILAEAGFRWMASDEDILARSLNGGEGWRRALYQPFRLETTSGPISILFRDKQLSDLVGFVYMRWSAQTAADDFVERILAAGRNASVEGPPLITVILDGENCWEYYERDGGPFLDALYARLLREPEIALTTPERFLAEHPPRAVLKGLFPGSWIDHSFHMWIGEAAKNQAWEMLAAAREAFARAELDQVGDRERARALLDVAEGSDWFWWYTTSPDGPAQPAFDALFRLHLQEVYRALGQSPPRDVLQPVTGGTAPSRPPEAAPLGLVRPIVDGVVTTFYEWAHAGHAGLRAASASMARSPLYLRDLYYGFDLANLHCRVDLTEKGRAETERLTVTIEFLTPHPMELSVKLSEASSPGEAVLTRAGGAPERCGRACFQRILEISAPFEALGLAADQEVSFVCHVMNEGQVVESFPPLGQISFRTPTSDFEETMWSA
jgi:alpha-amylase/alpha-mannosidase (GH57 family)